MNLLREAAYYLQNVFVTNLPINCVRLLSYKIFLKSVGKSTFFLRGVKLKFARNITIGSHCVINSGVHLDGRGGLIIGDNVDIASDAMLITAGHDINSNSHRYTVAPVVVHNRSWIATRAMILPGVTLGEGSVVAAGAVVTRDVPAFTVVGGVPAREIGKRNNQLNYQLYYRPWLG